MVNSKILQVEKGRVTQIFRYLQALDQLRNPAKRLVREQLWNLWIREMPQHSTVSFGTNNTSSNIVNSDETPSSDAALWPDYVLKIGRPQLTTAPAPPHELSAWLHSGWDDPAKSVEVISEREFQDQNGDPATEKFEHDTSRTQLLRTWQVLRDEWATTEKPVREAMHTYERFYDLHAQIARESERLELVLGDGILNWRRPEGGVHHPLLLQRLQLEFNADRQEFILREADHPVEFYSALFRGMTDVNGQVIGKFRDEVESKAYHPLGDEETDGFLHRLSVQLAAHGEFVGPTHLTGEMNHPRVGRDPIIFLRARTLGFATALNGILEDLAERTDLPSSLLGVVGVESPPPNSLDSTISPSSFSDGNEDEQVLLSKPANPEQLAIAQRLEKHGSVLVQGPPGTGKTHTIANLIGHLLAQGKTVLVTSHTTKALRVLREKVVAPLQPLCVSVLENDGESRQQLESAVNSIVERLSSSDAGQLEREANRLISQRSRLIHQLHETRKQLCDARAGEYRDIVLAGGECSPSDAAREVAQGREIHNWIPAPVSSDAPLPLSHDELVDLYRTNGIVTIEDEHELEASLPTTNQLLTPDAFERLVQEEQKLKNEDLHFGAELWRNVPGNQKPETLNALLAQLTRAIKPEDQEWRLAAIAAGHEGGLQRETWENLLRLIESVSAEALQSKEALLSHGPTLANDLSLEDQERLLSEMIAHLERGGNLGAFTLLTRRSWKNLLEATRVSQVKPTRVEHFKALHGLVRLHLARRDLLARWERQMTPLGAPAPSEMGEEPENACTQFVLALRECLHWHSETWKPLEAEIVSCGLDWSSVLNQVPPILAAHSNLLRIRNVVQEMLPRLVAAQINRLSWQHVQQTVKELERRVATGNNQDTQTAPSVTSRLHLAVTQRDVTLYREAYARLIDLAERRTILEQRRALLQRLEAVAPAWATAISKRHTPHDSTAVLGDPALAWRWRQLQDELERRDQVSIADLQKNIEHVTKEIRNSTAELIDRRAWAAQVLRTTGPQRKALIGWVQTIRKIGKGTGKRVPQLQADARRLMNECRSAVPVWIMPLARVVENFDPRRARFDVVIIDEASQSDVMGLIAFYLGRQVVVVGDDEQVSPDAVGQKVDEVQHLIDEHLSGIPNANLYDGKYSVYDVAMSSFGGTICLREHFRCVPDIIRFSNYLSYGGRIKALRDASTVHLRPHVISYRVEGTQTENKVNEVEAVTIASLLAACIEQPEYSGTTFGVVSLVGLQQAERIDFLLRSHLEPAEYERRHIVCGNAAHFQGDERDVMFLSVVDAPKDGPLRMNDLGQYRKRLNVAASRARDQMWVVHSLQPEIDLKPGDLRRRFLEYAQDPEALERLFEREEAHVESEFERQVLRRLLSVGYRVVPQWKVGAYRIDLVVEGEGKRLAVECDGDRFHGLDKLPDDMARQAILERLGWTFARIRGSDFFRDPDRAMQLVFARLQEMGIEPLGNLDSDNAEPVIDTCNELQERIIRRAAELRQEWEQRNGQEIEVSNLVADPTQSNNGTSVSNLSLTD